MKLQRVCGLGVIKHIIPLIIVPNQYYVVLTYNYICYHALLLLGRVSAGDKWCSSRPTLPIKTAFSSQHVWLFGAGPGLDTASIAVRAWFIRSQEHCSTYGDHFMNYGHRNTCLKKYMLYGLRRIRVDLKNLSHDTCRRGSVSSCVHAGRPSQNDCLFILEQICSWGQQDVS